MSFASNWLGPYRWTYSSFLFRRGTCSTAITWIIRSIFLWNSCYPFFPSTRSTPWSWCGSTDRGGCGPRGFSRSYHHLKRTGLFIEIPTDGAKMLGEKMSFQHLKIFSKFPSLLSTRTDLAWRNQRVRKNRRPGKGARGPAQVTWSGGVSIRFA